MSKRWLCVASKPLSQGYRFSLHTQITRYIYQHASCYSTQTGHKRLSHANYRFNPPEPIPPDTLVESKDRQDLLSELVRIKETLPIDIPCIINGEPIFTENKKKLHCPYFPDLVIATYSVPTEEHIRSAVEAAVDASHNRWGSLSHLHRINVFHKFIMSLDSIHTYTQLVCSTVLASGATFQQALPDSTSNLADVVSVLVHNISKYYGTTSPLLMTDIQDNILETLEHRSESGWILTKTGWHTLENSFEKIAQVALTGNTQLWIPEHSYQILTNFLVMNLLFRSGLPSGVVNFLPGVDLSSEKIRNILLGDPRLIGVNYGCDTYREYKSFMSLLLKHSPKDNNFFPKVVGNVVGYKKNFMLVHNSYGYDDNYQTLISALIRSAFDYAGQKVNSIGTIFVPESLWKVLKAKIIEELAYMSVSTPEQLSTFMGCVTSQKTVAGYNKIVEFVNNNPTDHVFVCEPHIPTKDVKDAEVMSDKPDDDVGELDPMDWEKGNWLSPMFIKTNSLESPLLKNSELLEVYGPILTGFVYPDEALNSMLAYIENNYKGTHTGIVFCNDVNEQADIEKRLPTATKNLIFNDAIFAHEKPYYKLGDGWQNWTDTKYSLSGTTTDVHVPYEYMYNAQQDEHTSETEGDDESIEEDLQEELSQPKTTLQF